MRAVQNEDKSTTPTYSIKINVQTLGRLNSINHAQDALCFPQSCNYQQQAKNVFIYKWENRNGASHFPGRFGVSWQKRP